MGGRGRMGKLCCSFRLPGLRYASTYPQSDVLVEQGLCSTDYVGTMRAGEGSWSCRLWFQLVWVPCG